MMLVTLVCLWLVAGSATAGMEEDIALLKQNMQLMARQMMMQQFYIEEMTRSDSNSGLKQIRVRQFGQRPHRSASHVDHYIASIHNHANNIRTIGMGEMVVVLNGIEFRTRHNDYMLKKKHSTLPRFRMTEAIEFPEVPSQVTEKRTVSEQVEEMKLWFQAFKNQNHTVRDYRPFFKPILSYLEGYWSITDMSTLDEPFDSDRHFIDAKSWLDLQDKVRFLSYSGGKVSGENLAYLPTTIIYLENNGTTPVLAQWNYRILCQPLKDDLPTSYLHPVVDLKTKVAFKFDHDNYMSSRSARFTLSEPDKLEKRGVKHLLDDLMEQIPGLNNDIADLKDDVLGELSYTKDGNEPLNVGYYHRVYRVVQAGASGLKIRHRSFADETMFVAQTTQPKVPALSIEYCSSAHTCNTWIQRWSYAIPLEIIYMTPLTKWNPYNVVYRGKAGSPEGRRILYDSSTGEYNRNGSPERAFNGINSKVFYQTPHELFEDAADPDPADTTRNAIYVLDQYNVARPMRASGHRINLDNIPGVGTIRQRYPIMPIHGEGSAIWKELSALQDMILDPNKFSDLAGVPYVEGPPAAAEKVFIVWMSRAFSEFMSHQHSLTIEESEVKAAMAASKGNSNKWVIEKITELEHAHEHKVGLSCSRQGKVVMVSCDGLKNSACMDGHSGFTGMNIDDICLITPDSTDTAGNTDSSKTNQGRGQGNGKGNM